MIDGAPMVRGRAIRAGRRALRRHTPWTSTTHEDGTPYLYHANNNQALHKTTLDGSLVWTVEGPRGIIHSSCPTNRHGFPLRPAAPTSTWPMVTVAALFTCFPPRTESTQATRLAREAQVMGSLRRATQSISTLGAIKLSFPIVKIIATSGLTLIRLRRPCSSTATRLLPRPLVLDRVRVTCASRTASLAANITR